MLSCLIPRFGFEAYFSLSVIFLLFQLKSLCIWLVILSWLLFQCGICLRITSTRRSQLNVHIIREPSDVDSHNSKSVSSRLQWVDQQEEIPI